MIGPRIQAGVVEPSDVDNTEPNFTSVAHVFTKWVEIMLPEMFGCAQNLPYESQANCWLIACAFVPVPDCVQVSYQLQGCPGFQTGCTS
jgi:hypothetical protein